jgi:hypothetical protein
MRMPQITKCSCGEEFDADRQQNCLNCKSYYCEKCCHNILCIYCLKKVGIFLGEVKDVRNLLMFINKLKEGWKGGSDMEYKAMEYGISETIQYIMKL